MDTQTDGELDAFGLLENLIQVSQGRDHPQPGTYRPLCIIFMGVGITEVHEEPVTEELSDISIVALDHVGTHPLILAHHRTRPASSTASRSASIRASFSASSCSSSSWNWSRSVRYVTRPRR